MWKHLMRTAVASAFLILGGSPPGCAAQRVDPPKPPPPDPAPPVWDASAAAEEGRKFQAAGRIDSAYAYYGSALELESVAHARTMSRLLESSPLLQQRRSLPAEVAFVAEVRNLVASTPAGAATASQIESADQAMSALEGMLGHREAVIEVRSPVRGFTVSYRRWLYRNDPAALWAPLAADTTIRVPAAAYEFKFRPPGSDRDTTVTLPCANGCRVPPGN